MRSLHLSEKHQSYQPKRRQLPPPFAPISSPPRKFGSCQHLTLHHPLQPNLGIIKSSQKWHRTTFHVRHSQSVRNKGHVLNNKQNNVDIRHTIDVKLMYVDRLPSISMALHNINRRILQTFHLFNVFIFSIGFFLDFTHPICRYRLTPHPDLDSDLSDLPDARAPRSDLRLPNHPDCAPRPGVLLWLR